MTHDMRHLDYIDVVRDADVRLLREKEATYQGSWKRAGGRSAWFMLRRNMDRLLTMLAPPMQHENFRVQNVRDLADNVDLAPFGGGKMEVKVHTSVHNYAEDLRYLCRAHAAEDIFAKIEEQPGGEDGTVLACVRDLRCYLTLVEAEMMARGVVASRRASRRANECKPKVMVPDPLSIKEHIYTPGTPEDGGHHAGTEYRWPHVIPADMAYGVFVRRDVADEYRDLFWTRRGDRYVLDTYVESVAIPRSLRGYMSPNDGDSWTINVAVIPTEVRSDYPNLTRELNAVEHDELPPWQRKLYEWQVSEGKYMLTVPEWHVNEE